MDQFWNFVFELYLAYEIKLSRKLFFFFSFRLEANSRLNLVGAPTWRPTQSCTPLLPLLQGFDTTSEPCYQTDSTISDHMPNPHGKNQYGEKHCEQMHHDLNS